MNKDNNIKSSYKLMNESLNSIGIIIPLLKAEIQNEIEQDIIEYKKTIQLIIISIIDSVTNEAFSITPNYSKKNH